MRPRSIAVGTATLIAAASMTPVVASADGQNTLYVNSANHSCTDSGTGTADAPFCTISAAAAAAAPGDTVNIAAGLGYASTTITRSGTADAPIVFTGNTSTTTLGGANGANGPLVRGLDLSGASNIEIENLRVTFGFDGGDTATNVEGGSNITLADTDLTPEVVGVSALHITDSASNVTVRDSTILGEAVVDGGATDTVLTTNSFSSANPALLSLIGSVSTAVTSNDFSTGCGPAVSVTGSSSGTRIENNLVRSSSTQCTTPVQPYGLVVDASSAAGTMADYNDIYTAGADAYDWNGVSYTTAASLYSAVGQGRHDDNSLAGVTLNEGSPAIDSADSAAVGEQPVDYYGQPHILDPLVKPTGAGPDDYYDRGAQEFQDPVTPVTKSLTSSPSATGIPVGTPLTLNAAMTDTWSDDVTYSFVVNGTTLAAETAGSYSTSFSTPGKYNISIYATPTDGSPRAATPFATLSITVLPVTPLVAAESITTDGTARGIIASDTGTTDDWNITKVTFDFGDGTPVVTTTNGQFDHTYAKGGTYNVTETVTDADSNTKTITEPITTTAPAPGTLSNIGIGADGFWGGEFETPPPGTGIKQAAVAGMPNNTLQAVAVSSAGTLEFATRAAGPGDSGVWSAWTTLSQPGVTVTGASIAGMPNGSTQIIEVTSTGILKHDIRNANGTWQTTGWGTPTGSTGIKQAAITAMPNGNTQLVAVTTSGILLHNIRFANGTWQGWNAISQPGVTVTDASIAGAPDGSSQLVEVTSTGVLKHDIRNANGSWQTTGWGIPVGSADITQASITVLPAGVSETVAITTNGTVEVDRRSTKWSGWIAPGIEEFNGSETFASDAALPDNSTQVLLVNGG